MKKWIPSASRVIVFILSNVSPLSWVFWLVHKLRMLRKQTGKVHSREDLVLSILPDFPFSLSTSLVKRAKLRILRITWKMLLPFNIFFKKSGGLRVLYDHSVCNTDINLQANHSAHMVCVCGLVSLYSGDRESSMPRMPPGTLLERAINILLISPEGFCSKSFWKYAILLHVSIFRVCKFATGCFCVFLNKGEGKGVQMFPSFSPFMQGKHTYGV